MIDAQKLSRPNTDVRPVQRLSEAFVHRPSLYLRSMEIVPSNIQAIQAATQFARKAISAVAIIGPSGWGKSIVLECTAELMRTSACPVKVMTAKDWLKNDAAWTSRCPLLLDEVQQVFAHTSQKQALRWRIRQRVDKGLPTFLSISDRRLRGEVERLLQPRQKWVIKSIEEPTEAERQQIVERIAAEQGLRIHGDVAKLIALRMRGNGRSISGCLQTIGLAQKSWTGRESVLSVCGALRPYLDEVEGWDLRDEVQEAVRQTLQTRPGHSECLEADMVCYILLKRMQVGEKAAASFLNISDSAAYVRAQSISKLADHEAYKPLIDACISTVISRLTTA